MDEAGLIKALNSHFSQQFSVPVRTSGMDNERPVPVIIIEDWNTRDMDFHNSAFSGEAVGDFDNDGNLEYERYLTFDWNTRVEFLIRHTDEVDVTELKGDVKDTLRLIGEYPQQFHDSVKRCNLGGGGNPTYQFTEPTESELMLSARFFGDHTVTLTPSDLDNDIIEQVKTNFTFNP